MATIKRKKTRKKLAAGKSLKSQRALAWKLASNHNEIVVRG